ncbi:MAG: quinone oxidoreductase [Anaerolineales bacterium]
MIAVRVNEFGDPGVLRCEELPVPEPGEGEVRVKIDFAGVNFIDIYQRRGMYPGEVPFIPGLEAAGTVDKIGPLVDQYKPGDRVAYTMQQGAYATYAVVPTWKVVPIPRNVKTQLAAGLLLQGLTAHYLSHSTVQIRPGDTVLIHAAAGGVGQLLVQMAKRKGAKIIATVSTNEKARYVRRIGADEVIVYTDFDFKEETRRITNGKGVSVVYDSVGKSTFQQSLNCLKPCGYLILFGQSSGYVSPIDPMVLNAKGSLFLTRPSLEHYVSNQDELFSRVGDLFEWVSSGKLHVRVDKVFKLTEVTDAHRYMEARMNKGKVLLET